MNSSIAFCIGPLTVYWSGLIIAFGALAAFLLTYALYTAHSGRGGVLWLFFALSLFFGLVLSRLIHFLSRPEQYAGLFGAFTDFSRGSFWLPGALLGMLPAAMLMPHLGIHTEAGEILDAAAPGAALFTAMVRFSALFNLSCRSAFHVTARTFQHLPFAVASGMTDASGNTVYLFASFFVMGILMLLGAVALVGFYIRCHGEKMRFDELRHGNIAKIFLAGYSAAEFVIDSTRADALPLRLFLIRAFNPDLSSLHLTQIFAITALCLVMGSYVLALLRARAFERKHRLFLGVFAASLVGCIATEILVRRGGKALFLLYAVQFLLSVLAVAMIFLVYRSCREPLQQDEDLSEYGIT